MGRHLIESDIDILVDKKAANLVVVNAKSDLPAPVTGVITLLANTKYLFTGAINLGTDHLQCSDGTIIYGTTPHISKITYTGTGAAIRGTDTSLDIFSISLEASDLSGKVFELTNALQTKDFVFKNSIVENSNEIGDISGFNIVRLLDNIYTGNTEGWDIVNPLHIFITNQYFDNTNSGIFIDIQTGTLGLGDIQSNVFNVTTGNTGLRVDAPNITFANSLGIYGNTFLGVGTLTSGYTHTDLNIEQKNNIGIEGFDVLGSYGWAENIGTFTISGGGVWDKITGGTSVAGDLVRMSHVSPNRLVYDGIETKTFNIQASMALDYESGSAFIAEVGVGKNGADPVVGAINGMTIYASDEPCSISAIVTLAQGDYIEAFASKLADGSQTVKAGFLNVTAVEIG